MNNKDTSKESFERWLRKHNYYLFAAMIESSACTSPEVYKEINYLRDIYNELYVGQQQKLDQKDARIKELNNTIKLLSEENKIISEILEDTRRLEVENEKMRDGLKFISQDCEKYGRFCKSCEILKGLKDK